LYIYNKGAMTHWLRNCPKCDKEIKYTIKGSWYNAKRNNSQCKECQSIENGLSMSIKLSGIKKKQYRRAKVPIKLYPRNCSICGSEMLYSTKSNHVLAVKRNTGCRKCKNYKFTYDDILKAVAKRSGFDTYEELRETMPAYAKYANRVRSLTRKQPLHLLENYDKPKGVMGQEGAWQLDHIISIYEGFQKGISPEIISELNNLQFIPWEENLRKSKN
jgi:hypothetical protein